MFWLALFGLCSTTTSLLAGDWPNWRGPDRDDVSKETGLLKAWPNDGPKQIWSNSDVGLGYSSFAIAGGKLFTIGAREDTEFLICLDENSGKELWAARVGTRLDDGRGDGPRGTPTIAGDAVCAMGGQGTVICAAIDDGNVRWQKTMSSLGGRKPGWGFCESVLVDGDRVICTPGGSEGAIVALNKADGEIVWRSTDLTDRAGYSSIVPVEINGQPQYIQLFMEKVAGISAKDGKLLWKSDWPGKTAVIPTPIYHDGHVFITSGYGVGCKLVKVVAGSQIEDVYFNRNMKNHHGGVLRVGEHLYGYSDGLGWMCLDFKTGEVVWSEKSALGKGAVTCADGMLYCVDERDGSVVLAEASPAGWKEHGRFKLPKSSQRAAKGMVWTHPVVSNGKLFLRDQEILSCYDVKAQ
jgi:outer membrane protein assembly factor BamB